MKISKYNSEGYFDPVPRAALSSIKKEKTEWKPLVYICSPYSGDTALNTEKARHYCRFAIDSGAIPLAPHLFLPQFMSEETERAEAMFMNRVFLGRCEELWVFGDSITEGMMIEIGRAEEKRKPVRYFTEECKEKGK